jgi:hypothetical protein
MFFFIAGVQPKTKTLDPHPHVCHNCGQVRLIKKRTDHYLSLFFIPLFPVKRGKPFLECENCRFVFDEHVKIIGKDGIRSEPAKCPDCGRPVGGDHVYCPYCGKHLS